MKNDNYLKIKKLFYIICIISIVVSIWFKVSKAAEMEEKDITYIEQLLNGVDNYNALKTDLEFVYSNFPYFVHLHSENHEIILFTSDSSIISRHYIVDYSNYDPKLNKYFLYGFRGSTNRMYLTADNNTFTMASSVTNPHSNHADNLHIAEVQLVIQNYYDASVPVKTASLGCYCLYDNDLLTQTFSNNIIDYDTGETSLTSSTFYYNYFTSTNCRQNWVTSSTGNTYNNPFQLKGKNTNDEFVFTGSYNYLEDENLEFYTNHLTYIPDGNNLNFSVIYGYIQPNIQYNNDNNTSTPGLKVYKQDIHNQKYLYVDYSDLISVGSHTSSDSVLNLTINIDETETEYNFDSDYSYYHWDIATGKVYYQLPYSALGLSDVNNISSAIVSNVEVTVGVYAQGGQENIYHFYYYDNIFLIGNEHNTGYTPNSQNKEPEQTYNNNLSSINSYNYALIHYHSNSPFYYNSAYSYSTLQEATASINGAANILTSLNCYIINEDGIIEDNKYIIYVNYGQSNIKEDLISLGDYAKDNSYALYYDVVICQVHDYDISETPTSYNDLAYIVLYTHSYFVKNGINSMSLSLKDIVEYDRICSEYLYDIYNDFFDKLTNIDTNTSSFFTNTENIFTDIISNLENINSFLPDLSSLLNRIIDILQDLHLSQLDSIDAKLSTIIDNISTSVEPINEDDTIQEAIAYYNTHTQTEAVLEDKYSVWFTGYCHFWLQEYQEIPTRSNNNFYSDHVSEERRNIILNTYHVITSLYDNMQQDLMFNRVTEMFDYFLGLNTDNVSHTRQSYFSDIFDEEMIPTLDYNPYE